MEPRTSDNWFCILCFNGKSLFYTQFVNGCYSRVHNHVKYQKTLVFYFVISFYAYNCILCFVLHHMLYLFKTTKKILKILCSTKTMKSISENRIMKRTFSKKCFSLLRDLKTEKGALILNYGAMKRWIRYIFIYWHVGFCIATKNK